MMTGKELTLKRVALDVAAGALAERIGVPPSVVSRWEHSRTVNEKAAARYLEALATFGTIPTISVTVGPEPEAVA